MRKLIIDTDTGSDDAVALIMALRSDDVKVEAVTTVFGNVPVDIATKNALMTIEVASGQQPPLYVGAAKPRVRDLLPRRNVHGCDGMGGKGLIHPTLEAKSGNADDTILDIVAANPGEIEIVMLGPATNIALAIQKAPEVMKAVKHIYSMGTAGFGSGNITPVAEFNVYVDAESYKIVMEAGISVTIVGFDLCLGNAALNESDLNRLKESGKPAAVFAAESNAIMLDTNEQRFGKRIVTLPDPLAMGVCLWKELLLEAEGCYCYVCTIEEPAYGQVILYDAHRLAQPKYQDFKPNATVCRRIDNARFKEKLMDTLLR